MPFELAFPLNKIRGSKMKRAMPPNLGLGSHNQQVPREPIHLHGRPEGGGEAGDVLLQLRLLRLEPLRLLLREVRLGAR